ncbi:uncharacterized protein LOC122047242 isoform X1 [Zingiber officinale]|uniref:uncharacterized protein LOC122047242 isoform X1 n=1 Tax=Zingiber officinale TaxID=94328 RepID=UPI001C4ACF67|nr:uncharacterized protein LOC122047242 isoform X1 [Zingiber officinale]XP_042464325.1 uncharacterized protein LOC122047242 isoform X1 [Zingiber officinale]XP_042464326.1 uncharacterized protein LOC122047242 isoform X1 [Zingiber officinale]XP_042464327.1 uncharacterized protein LOC122047242 isoform X1 [Zingiber officinale]
MESLPFVLPRLGQSGTLTLTGPSFGRGVVRFVSFAPVKASSGAEVTSVSCSAIAPAPDARPGLRRTPPLALLGGIDDVEEKIEKVIYKCRFFAFLAVAGSLMGSIICFLKGCTCVIDSYREYFDSGAKVVLMLVEAIGKPIYVYLVGTVMLVFGMGLYEIFISNLDIAKMSSHGSNLLGLFKLMERPRWLEIQSINELKTKLGHVIVMVLLVGMFEKSKKVTISSPTDLLCFAASILLSSGCLYLLSKLHSTK